MSTPLQAPLDTARAEAFAGELLQTLNHGALCLMISVGHRTGLFDTMSNLPPVTSDGLAAAAKLNERYVREWLGAMVTGGVVTVDPATQTYYLPAEHAAFLTRGAGANNLAAFAQDIPLLGAVENEIVDCFHKGGGVPYSRYCRFHEVMAEFSGMSVLSSIEEHIIPLVPGLHDRLSAGIRMLDVGCGRGRILNRLAALYPDSHFTGMDLCAEVIEFANEEAAAAGLSNIEFHVRDLSNFHESADEHAYDFVTTFDAVHDQAKPLNVLRGIQRTLRPGGVYLMQDINGSSHHHKDIDHPIGTLLYTVSCMHCMSVSLAQGGEGLGAMWGIEKTKEYLANAGFENVAVHNLSHDIVNNWYVITK